MNLDCDQEQTAGAVGREFIEASDLALGSKWHFWILDSFDLRFGISSPTWSNQPVTQLKPLIGVV
jgi:hypothetical protein